MGIVFRHDAAGVVPPSNNTTRKYGQQLVLQQKQQDQQLRKQKYLNYQANMERANAWNMQAAQNQFLLNRDQQQNQFQLGRDQAQLAQEQQRQDTARQQAAMQRAFEMKAQNVRQSIQNGEFDRATAMELQKNLEAEAELQGFAFDDRQRIEKMPEIQKQREALLGKRLPVKTEQQKFDEGVVVDSQTGIRYRRNARGEYESLTPDKQQPQQPRNAQEYYTQNPDKFGKDLDATMKELQDKVELGEITKEEATTEKAVQKMREAYDARENARMMMGGMATPSGAPVSTAPTTPSSSSPASDPNDFHSQMIAKGYKLSPATESTSAFYYKPPAGDLWVTSPGAPPQQTATPADTMSVAPQPITAPGPFGQGTGDSPYYFRDALTPSGVTQPAPSQPQPEANPWKDIGAADPVAFLGSPQQMRKSTGKKDERGYVIMDDGSRVHPDELINAENGLRSNFNRTTHPDGSVVLQPPNFTKLLAGANKNEQGTLRNMREIYDELPAEGQSAMSVILSESATKADKAAAANALLAMGVDLKHELLKRASTKASARNQATPNEFGIY